MCLWQGMTMEPAITSSDRLKKALSLPNGARFYRCALQVNPFAYDPYNDLSGGLGLVGSEGDERHEGGEYGSDPETVHFFALLKSTTFTVIGTSSLLSSSSINVFACSWLKPPDPAPINGKAIDVKSFSWASRTAFLTESRIDRSDALQSILIPAT